MERARETGINAEAVHDMAEAVRGLSGEVRSGVEGFLATVRAG